MAGFENSQIDTKDLSDIYQYRPFMKRLGLARYEYTLRELFTGTCFFAYADRNNSTYASLFANYVIERLKSYGISTIRIYWQTDNGSEFPAKGGVRKKIRMNASHWKHCSTHVHRIQIRTINRNTKVDTMYLYLPNFRRILLANEKTFYILKMLEI